MKVYTHEEMLDRVIGEKGSPAREKYENDINNFLIGEAIKQTREAKNLTQEQLGELMGVKRAQISKIEKRKKHFLFYNSKSVQGNGSKNCKLRAWLFRKSCSLVNTIKSILHFILFNALPDVGVNSFSCGNELTLLSGLLDY